MKYLLDANTFIEAKNRYYNMTVCPACAEVILDKEAGQRFGLMVRAVNKQDNAAFVIP
jgi:Domain of unknown function (DUF4411)